MSTLLEDLYDSQDIDINKFANLKIRDLSNYQKSILDINNFHGDINNSLFDVTFMRRLPLQMVYYKYKFLMRSMGV